MQNEVLNYLGHPIEIVRVPRYRGVRMTINEHSQIRVRCPLGASEKTIFDFLEERQLWIKKCLQKMEAQRQKFPAKKYATGELFYLFGDAKKLEIQEGPGSSVQLLPETLRVCVKNPTPDRVALALSRFYQGVGRRYLLKRIEIWSNLMGLKPQKVHIRGQKTRWGTCSSKKIVSLNWKLIGAPPDIIDYVIVHELSHLRHLNHSRKFWELVSQFVSGLQEKKKWLKEKGRFLDWTPF